MRRVVCTLAAAALLAATGRGAVPQAEPQPLTLAAAIDNLGNLDYETRMNAGRTIRRTPANAAVPALLQAVAEHADGFVRFRALVLLTGFNDPRAADLVRQLLADPNDRLRQVAYNYFEHFPEPSVTPLLLQALEKEQSEFVRPSLVRALAASGGDARVREALTRDVDRGVDFFRSIVIEALGEYKAAYAVTPLMRVAQLDGPLQDDAALALGKIGERRALEALTSAQRSAPRSAQPAIAAAICLLGVNCSSHQGYVEESLRFAAANDGFQDLLRSSAAALGALASAGRPDALGTLFDVGVPSRDPARAPIALAIGMVAIRNTDLVLQALERPGTDLDSALGLLAEAFDMLEEDFEEEQFFVSVRKRYWQAPEDSPTRAVTQALIDKLLF